MTQVQATLSLDSWQGGVDGGSRSMCDLAARTLVYSSGPFNVDLMVHGGPDEEHFAHGQLTRGLVATPVTDAVMRVGEDGEPVAPDDFGQFALSIRRSVGPQSLIIDARQTRIVCVLPGLT